MPVHDVRLQSSEERLFAFWLKAVRYGFGNCEATPCAPKRRQFPLAFRFASGSHEYREEFAGTIHWGGDEVIVHDLDRVAWRLSAHGTFEPPFRGLENDGLAIREVAPERLREAISSIRIDDDLDAFVPRGPLEYRMDSWVYRCAWEGDFSEFSGVERVSREGVTVLTQRFHGGMIL
jgi:hypothetical protein